MELPAAAPAAPLPVRCCRTHSLETRWNGVADGTALSVEEAVELAKLHANSEGDAWMMMVGEDLRGTEGAKGVNILRGLEWRFCASNWLLKSPCDFRLD